VKHRLKLLLRDLYARLLFHTGLHALVDRLAPRRLTILFGHCVDAPEVNGGLPADMKIRAASLARILGWLKRRYRVVTIDEGLRSLADGNASGSLVALSMDDGYKDNATHLLPLLAEVGVPATIFLETRPLDERRLNWSHLYFWLLDGRLDAETFARGYLERSEDPAALEGLRRALEEGAAPDRLAYRVKRVLKYEADEADRDRVVSEIFHAHGGDERALCDAIWMTWDEVRRLRDAGWELGAHTAGHAILSRLDVERARDEVERAASSMERELGTRGATFAYPFGRRWDYDEGSREVVRAAGYRQAVMTHAGTNTRAMLPSLDLRRIAIDDGTRLHLLCAEACGGFELLRRLGVDLSE
jgi:peptidoglycan/xylan/chitin deacetylase (PgdA/CDA1 family)